MKDRNANRRHGALMLVMALVVGACGSTPTVTAPAVVPTATAAASSVAVPSPAAPSASVEPTAAAEQLKPGFAMYKGNAARTGEAMGPAPVGPIGSLWKVETPGPIKSAPVVVGATMFIVAGDRHVVAMDVASGVQQWSSSDGGYVGTLATTRDRLFVLGIDGSLSALSISSGTRLWHAPGKFLPDMSPLAFDDLVVVGGSDFQLRAFNVLTGAEAWSATTGGTLVRGASTDGGVVYVGSSDGYVYAFDAGTGARRWSFQSEMSGFATTAVRDGTVYASGNVSDGNAVLFALDAATGIERWRFAAPDHLGLRSPTIDASAVYVAGTGQQIYSLNPSDGALRWTAPIASAESPMTVVGDTLLFFGRDRSAHALDKATGTERWSYPIGSEVEAGTTVVNGRLLAGTPAGEILAIGAEGLALAPTATPSPDDSGAGLVDLVGELTAPDDLAAPSGIDVDPDGRIWVVEGGRDGFAIFANDGTFIERWGTSGSGPGEFNFDHANSPAGDIIFRPDGGFYVVDVANFRVQEFNRDRTFVRAWGGFGKAHGQFIDPYAVALDDAGNVYVLDQSLFTIDVFTADGRYLRSIGAGVPGVRQFTPTEMEIHDDRIYVADWDSGRIVIFNTDGTFLKALDRVRYQRPSGVSVGPDGIVYVSVFDSKKFLALTPDGDLVAEWAPDGHPYAAGIKALADGRVLAIGWASDPPGNERVGIYRLQVPAAVAQVVGELTGAPGGISKPVGIGADPSGRVWVAEGGRHDFAIFDSDGQFIERWGSKGSEPGQFDFGGGQGNPVADIAFAPDGTFVVADQVNRRVQRFDADRNVIAVWGAFGKGNGQFISPENVAIDGAGNVYVQDYGRNDVQVFDPTGKYLRTITDPRPGAASRIFGDILVFDDRLIVSEDGGQIALFDLDGTLIDHWTGIPAWSFAPGPGDGLTIGDRTAKVVAADGTTISELPCTTGSICPFVAALPDERIAVVEWSHDPVGEDEHVRIYRLP